MNIGEDIRISLRSIIKRPVESMLLVLGIALGIGATAAGIAMISHSNIAEKDLLSSPQYREIIVQESENSEKMDLAAVPTGSSGQITLTWQDLAAKNEVPDVQYAYLSDDTQIRLFNSNSSARIQQFGPDSPADTTASVSNAGAEGGERGLAGQLNGIDPPVQAFSVPDGPEPVVDEIRGKMVTPEYFSAWDLNAAAGSLFTVQEMESGAPVIVLGSEIAQTLFEDGEALGRKIVAFQTLYEIVGILEPTEAGIDEMAFIPSQVPDTESIAAIARKFGGQEVSLHFTVSDPDRLEEAQAQLGEWFAQRYGDGRVVVTIPREEVEAARTRTARLTAIILFLAVAGLLIAAVNVSNILLGRALRKRKNVGILKALGATVKNVFTLFFLEAFTIGVAGAFVGAGISVLISNMMFTALGGGAVLSFMLVAGIVGAWAITISITVIPALQASRIPAVEALHYE